MVDKLYMTAGQNSDYTGVATLLDDLPATRWLLADLGYDADWFRGGLEEKGIRPCIPGRRSGTTPVSYHKSPTVSFSAICLASTVMFWL